MHEADQFIVYDNIEYAKKGWINRNRFLLNGKDEYFTLPLKKDSDYLDIRDRRLADTWEVEKGKLLNRVSGAYRKAPYFENGFSLLKDCLNYHEQNLFQFIYHSLNLVKDFLEITTPLIVSSTIEADHSLKSEDRVLDICKARGATRYINPIGGLELYSSQRFATKGIELQFIKSTEVQYPQGSNEFVPWLSILDVLMFNSQQEARHMVRSNYTII
jgi:hypothetical protein